MNSNSEVTVFRENGESNHIQSHTHVTNLRLSSSDIDLSYIFKPYFPCQVQSSILNCLVANLAFPHILSEWLNPIYLPNVNRFQPLLHISTATSQSTLPFLLPQLIGLPTSTPELLQSTPSAGDNNWHLEECLARRRHAVNSCVVNE